MLANLPTYLTLMKAVISNFQSFLRSVEVHALSDDMKAFCDLPHYIRYLTWKCDDEQTFETSVAVNVNLNSKLIHDGAEIYMNLNEFEGHDRMIAEHFPKISKICLKGPRKI